MGFRGERPHLSCGRQVQPEGEEATARHDGVVAAIPALNVRVGSERRRLVDEVRLAVGEAVI